MESVIEKINQSALKFLSSQTLEEVYATIAREAVQLVNGEFATIFLFKEGVLINAFSTPGFEDLVVRKHGYTYDAFKKNTPSVLQNDKILSIHPIVKKMKIKSILFIPLSYESKSIGVLTVRSTKNQHFSAQQLDVLKLFGSMASLAIQKTQSQNEALVAIEKKDKAIATEQILEKINLASLKFLQPLSPKDTYKTIVQEARKLVEGNEGLVMLKEDDALVTVYGSSPEAASVTPRKKGFAYQAYTKRKAFAAYSKDIQGHDPVSVQYGIKTWLFIPLSNQGQSIGTLVIRFTYEREFAKQELRMMELFGSLASLAIRKTQLYSEAQKALEVRDLFIAMAAHELRTPLTTINGYIQLLNTKVHNDDNTIQAKWTRQLLYESKRLTNLVSELLEVNRIKAGHFQFDWKECDLQIIIERALNSIRFTHPKRKIIFENEDTYPLFVIGDFDKLLQVITNLIDNAAKFSPSHTQIIIGLKSNQSYSILRVRDFGKGIDAKDIPLLFNEFFKGRRNQTEEGMGLGLFLAKLIVSQHHGTIQVFSKPDKGTTIEIKLPRIKK